MKWAAVITLLALFQFALFGALVAKARGAYQVLAPAITGHEQFERLNRVHLNTMERLVLFLPLLWMAAQTWSFEWLVATGAVYLLGRTLYWRGYMAAPSKRRLGNVLTMLSIVVLLLLNIVSLFK